MSNRDLVQRIQLVKHGNVNPRQEWVDKNRALLLSQIKNTVPEKNTASFESVWSALSIFMPRTVVYNFVRPIAVLLVVALVGTSGWIATVDAAYETLPGDWIYPVKRGIEKTQITVASMIGDKNTETKLHVEFAKRRANETRRIIESADPKKVELASATVAELKKEIANVNTKLEDAKNDIDTKIQAEVAKEVKQNTEQIKDVLQDVKTNLLIADASDSKNLSEEIKEIKEKVTEASLNAVDVMVTQHLNGDTSVSKEQVAEVLSATLVSAANQVGEAKQSVAGANTIIETVKTEVKDINADKKVSEVPTSSKQFAEAISTVASETKQAAIQTQAASVEVDKKITEAKEILNSGDLSQMVSKIREVAESAAVAQKISDTAIEKAQTVLPIVQVIKDGTVPPPMSLLPLPSTTASGSPIVLTPSSSPTTSVKTTTTPAATATPSSSPSGTTVKR